MAVTHPHTKRSMSAFFNKVFKGKDSAGSSSKKNLVGASDIKKAEDEDPWLKTEVTPEEISELLRLCTKELKLRGSYSRPTWGTMGTYRRAYV